MKKCLPLRAILILFVSAVFILCFSIHFSLGFVQGNRIWFLGGLMDPVSAWFEWGNWSRRYSFFRDAQIAFTLLSLLLAVWLLRRLPAYQRLSKGWQGAATVALLLFLGMLAAFGDWTMAIRLLNHPGPLDPNIWLGVFSLACSLIAILLTGLKDLLTPHVRRLFYIVMRRPQTAECAMEISAQKRLARRILPVLFAIAAVLFSFSFHLPERFWFFGAVRERLVSWLYHSFSPGHYMFAYYAAHVVLTLIFLLSAVWLFRRLSAYQKLTSNRKRAVTVVLLLFLGMLVAFGDLYSTIRTLDNLDTLSFIFQGQFYPPIETLLAGLLVFLKDFLAPHVRKLHHIGKESTSPANETASE